MVTPTLELHLLGDVRAWEDGRPSDALGAPRVRALLAYLLRHRGAPVSRQRIAFEFWPDSTEAQARTNLRNLLHTLRQAHPALASSLSPGASSLAWADDSVSVDVERFLVASQAALTTDPDDVDELVARCRDAMSSYGGSLLPDQSEPWVAEWRDELARRHREVLRTLATALIDEGRPGEALDVTAALVRGDPLDEPAHRLHIEAHAASGDRSGAVRAFHECVAELDRELGIGPSLATTELVASLLDQADVAPRAAPVARSPSRLVGRDGPWRELVGAWESVRDGAPRLVLVTGEPGIGKTRLADELAAWCRGSGAAVAEARSYLAEGELGFALIVSWLRSADLNPARSGAHVNRTHLSRLLPELGEEQTPGPGQDEALDEAERRRRLFEAVAMALAGVGRPTLLVADDAQWSDRASLEALHYLLRQPVEAPLLVVATARDVDLGADHALSVLRDSLVAIDRATELVLSRLPLDATRDLGQRLLGAELDEDAARALFGESEGNPLFVVETVRSGWDGGAGPIGLSPRLRAVIQGRLRQLGGTARDLVGAASVVGRPFRPRLLRTMTGMSDRVLAVGVDELWRRSILCEVRGDEYDFTHAKLREAAYDELSPAARRGFHGALAVALAEPGPGVPSSEVAGHFEAAGRTEEAVTWLQRAALEAHAVDAYEDSLRLLGRALDLVPDLPAAVRHRQELELLSSLPVALAGVGGYATRRMSETHKRAADVAAALGVDLDPAFVRSMVLSALCRDEFTRAGEMALRLHAHARADGDELLRVESHYLLGISAFWPARLEEARFHFETVVAEFDPATRPQFLATFGHDPQVVCQSRLANTLFFLGLDGEARRTCDRALERAEEVGHPLSHDTATIFAALLAVDLDDIGALRERAARLGSLGADSLPHQVKGSALRGLVAVHDGDPDGVARIELALERCSGSNFYPGFQATIVRILLAAYETKGVAMDTLEAAQRGLAMPGTPLWAPALHRARAQSLLAIGAPGDRVREALESGEAVARAQGAEGYVRRLRETRQRLLKRFGNGAQSTVTT